MKKLLQTAGEIKPTLQPAYINKFKRQSEAIEKDTVNSLNKKPNKLWSTHPGFTGRKKLAQNSKVSKKMLQRWNVPSEKISSSKSSPNTNRDKDIDAIKITTIVEAIRRRGQSAQIRGIIGNERSMRSPREMENNLSAGARSIRKKRATNERSLRPKRLYRNRRGESVPTEARATGDDLTAASNVGIPSDVFYKRIWEYINGTRPHYDITRGYGGAVAKSDFEKDNSTCVDQNPITVSQSRKNELRAVTPDFVEPRRALYEHIWDIINATRSRYGAAESRAKRDASIPEIASATVASASCVEEAAEERETTSRPRDASDPGLYASGFWTVANQTRWRPATVIPNVTASAAAARSSDGLTTSSRASAAHASEVVDSNEFRDGGVRGNADRSSAGSPTGKADEEENNEGDPTSSPPLESTESACEDSSPRDEGREGAARHSTDEPVYDLSKIPYAVVPGYSDRRENGSDVIKRRLIAAGREEYEDGDRRVDPERFHDDRSSRIVSTDGGSTKINSHPSAGNGSDECSSLVGIARCTENKNSDECNNNEDAESSRDDTEDDASDDARQPAEDSAESAPEGEDSTTAHAPARFGIDEVGESFDLDDFVQDNPVFQSTEATSGEERDANYDDSKESAESETYAAYPKEEAYDYFTKNEDSHDFPIFDANDEERKETQAEGEARNSEMIKEDYYRYGDKDFFKRIFERDRDQKSPDAVDTEHAFLSRYFTPDVLRQIQENSTAEEDRKREESRNKEDVRRTLSRILDNKDRFSRLDGDLDKMIERGETRPIRYNSFWSLEYGSPRRRNKAKKETKEAKDTPRKLFFKHK